MTHSLRMVLFGAPGAGKGTQALILKDQLGVPHISSGDLFRHHLKQGTPLGQEVSQYINQGALVPDEVTIGIILERVASLPAGEGFILDGFPRNLNQARALENALLGQSRGLDRVLYVDVPEAELVQRLGRRFTCRQCQAPHTLPNGPSTSSGPTGLARPLRCEKCGGELYQRPDDNLEAVQRRIQVYAKETLPLLDFYRERGLLADVPGVGRVEEVNRRIQKVLQQSQEPAQARARAYCVSKATNPG